MKSRSPSDLGSSQIFSPSNYSSKNFLEANWKAVNMAYSSSMSPNACFDTHCLSDCLGNHTSTTSCGPGVSRCDGDHCTTGCTTICDGFVDCDQATACSEPNCDDVRCDDAQCKDDNCEEAHCNDTNCQDTHCKDIMCTEPDCDDTVTACFDDSCFPDSHCTLDQATFDYLNQGLQWCNTSGINPSCQFSQNTGNISGHDLGHMNQQSMKQFSLSTPQDTTSVLKSADFQQYSSQCTYGKHPHILDGISGISLSDLMLSNSLHCNTHHSQASLDSCNTQCDFDFESLNSIINSHFGLVPWTNSHISQIRNQHMGASKPHPLQICHPHAHIHHHPSHLRSPSTHASSLSMTSSPVISPMGREQSISSTFTAPETPSTVETSHVCKWVRRINGTSRPCGAVFSDAAKLQEHLTLAHSDALDGACGHGYYCCWEGCHRPDEPFSQKSKLQGHFLTHSNFKNFRCSVCGKQFARQATLERHERSHRGDKPYKCKVCGKAFTDSSELKTHSRTHTGEKPFKCNYPGCTFQTGDSSNMSSHRLTHGERKHKCPHPGCTKSFTRPDQLKRHLRSTHKAAGSPYPLSPPSSRGLSITP